ncbi:tyrosine aminotransferase-like isoform X3 [Macrobrachium rosenbergii]|uniref:tyrosine aminotransferase-like isoform X3 n=1 Tax=Macrobrachium rosenbergii TaxID=79674 RepID=UPI0034D513FD
MSNELGRAFWLEREREREVCHCFSQSASAAVASQPSHLLASQSESKVNSRPSADVGERDNVRRIPEQDFPDYSIAKNNGDPTVFGNLTPAEEITEAVVTSIRSGKYNGYGPSTGFVEAREAVAKYCSVPDVAELEAKDIILCSGCSCSIDLCITALCAPGQNILVPRPGFPLYKTLAEGLSIKTKYYNLLPEKNWEVDLDMLEALIDEETQAIVVNNPSNPCGSVFSKEHLTAILEVAARNKVPVIADEIYDHFVFSGEEYHAMASLSQEVPVLSCGGLTKRYLIPGWRMGWIAIYDRNGVLDKEIRQGLQSLSQRIIGSNTLVQGALPAILSNTPKSFFDDTIKQIEDNAKMCYRSISAVPGLKPIMPQGAMYMMCFDYPNYMRIVLTVPEKQLKEACGRMAAFCTRYYQEQTNNGFANTNGHSVDMDIDHGYLSTNDINVGATVEEVKAVKTASFDPTALIMEAEAD